VRFNASAFYYDYADFQATFVRGDEASARLQNAGDVEIKGMEASLDWLPIQGLSISAGLSLLDTEIVETDVALLPLDGGDRCRSRQRDSERAGLHVQRPAALRDASHRHAGGGVPDGLHRS
jgi:hypothetical protein